MELTSHKMYFVKPYLSIHICTEEQSQVSLTQNCMRLFENVFAFSKVGSLNDKIWNTVLPLRKLVQRILKDTMGRERYHW